MFDKNYLLPNEALQLIIGALKKNIITSEKLKIENCLGRISATDIASPEDIPPFPRSTVDGYALNSHDSFGASETFPAYITVKYDIAMGSVPDFKVQKLQSARIPTGGMLPLGADAVVMLENAQIISYDMIEVTKSVAPGENVIQKGEDIGINEIIIRRGRRLKPQDIGALAAVGIINIDVFKKPVVSVISSGDEIVSHDMPVHLGQIRDINSLTLAGLVNDFGGIAIRKGIFEDDYNLIKDILMESIADSDMVLISGGTSAGAKDMVAMIINDIGKPGVLFHGLSLKPGKPMIGGIVNNIPILGLPGHPVAVVVCFNIFIKPILALLSGLNINSSAKRTIKAKMAKNIASVAGREDHIMVTIENKDGEIIAHPILGKSGLISVLIKADGDIIIPHNRTGLNAGDEVMVSLF